MANTSSSKGNPASHRMSNKHLQEKRKSCWANGEKRKKVRRDLNDAAWKKNKVLRAAGDLTPWEAAKMKRRASRVTKQLAHARLS